MHSLHRGGMLLLFSPDRVRVVSLGGVDVSCQVISFPEPLQLPELPEASELPESAAYCC